MPDILQDFPIAVPPSRVFQGVTDPALLDQWWTVRSSGRPVVGAVYELEFGPRYRWRAEVTRAEPDVAIEWRMRDSDADWAGTRLGFALAPNAAGTQVQFYHRGWSEENEHYRITCHCWALYLRVLRRHLEFGETVAYARRLEV
ncbi:MAG: SRPBCC domain-containing protein [Gemmatimonadaceae bacterium]|nr:SRPBCC domain-containing protein [Gemmatimonadaceae bacterium]